MGTVFLSILHRGYLDTGEQLRDGVYSFQRVRPVVVGQRAEEPGAGPGVPEGLGVELGGALRSAWTQGEEVLAPRPSGAV